MGMFDVHAFTESGKYADVGLAKQIHGLRYKILEKGQPIYCTAVRPDFKSREEHNPHDSLPSTIHFVSINRENGDIECALSTARDTGETYRGEIIGVPLENRYTPEPFTHGDFGKLTYLPGASLDRFRREFFRKNYNLKTNVPDGVIVELYRHMINPDSTLKKLIRMKNPNGGPDIAIFPMEGARLATYAGAYQTLIRDPLEKGENPSFLWVWDAIPRYANLYSFVGGVYRDMTINGKREWTWKPTRKSDLIKVGNQYFLRNGNDKNTMQVTRSLQILEPGENFGPEQRGTIILEPMIDGLVDVRQVESLIRKHALIIPNCEADFELKRRGSLGVACHRMYKDHHGGNAEVAIANEHAQTVTGTYPFEFEDEGQGNHSLLPVIEFQNGEKMRSSSPTEHALFAAGDI
jgi:hypothetical protein